MFAPNENTVNASIIHHGEEQNGTNVLSSSTLEKFMDQLNHVNVSLWRHAVAHRIEDAGTVEFSLFVVSSLGVFFFIYCLWVYKGQIARSFRRCCLSSDWRRINNLHENVSYNSVADPMHRQITLESDRLPLASNLEGEGDDDDNDDDEVDFFGALDSMATGESRRLNSSSTSNRPKNYGNNK